MANKDKYKYIILSTSIADTEYAYPVYVKVEPRELLYQNSHKTYFGEHGFLKYDNVYIGSIPSGRIRKIMDDLPGSVLYIGIMADRGNVDNELVIRDKDDSPLFITSHKD